MQSKNIGFWFDSKNNRSSSFLCFFFLLSLSLRSIFRASVWILCVDFLSVGNCFFFFSILSFFYVTNIGTHIAANNIGINIKWAERIWSSKFIFSPHESQKQCDIWISFFSLSNLFFVCRAVAEINSERWVTDKCSRIYHYFFIISSNQLEKYVRWRVCVCVVCARVYLRVSVQFTFMWSIKNVNSFIYRKNLLMAKKNKSNTNNNEVYCVFLYCFWNESSAQFTEFFTSS